MEGSAVITRAGKDDESINPSDQIINLVLVPFGITLNYLTVFGLLLAFRRILTVSGPPLRTDKGIRLRRIPTNGKYLVVYYPFVTRWISPIVRPRP